MIISVHSVVDRYGAGIRGKRDIIQPEALIVEVDLKKRVFD